MSEIVPPLLLQFGVGGIGGFLVGYAIKKIIKIIAIILGLFSSAIIYLSYTDIISVNYSKLINLVTDSIPLVNQAPFLTPIIANLPFAGSFGFGLTYGIKKG